MRVRNWLPMGMALVLVSTGCATQREWAVWRSHPTHYATDNHLGRWSAQSQATYIQAPTLGFDDLMRSFYEDSGEDAYLIATIQETLRIRPVLPNVAPRLVVKPIEIGGWTYPAGCSLVLNSYLIHHDPEIYPDPDRFQPERFLNEQPGTYTWIPFGGGRRRCLGASFAMLEMKIVLRSALTAFELQPEAARPEVARRRNITVRPSRGAQAVLAERRRAAVAA